jgi:stage IV sporulation protein FB
VRGEETRKRIVRPALRLGDAIPTADSSCRFVRRRPQSIIFIRPWPERLAAVFLSEPSETRFDLRFWLFGVHVRVHPLFWLLTILLGRGLVTEAPDQRTGLIHLGLWVICVFMSILIHEMGHVFMGRLFGSHGHIVLYSFGGLAIGSNALDRAWQRFLVSFAGPLIQFVVLGLTVLAILFLYPQIPLNWRSPVGTALVMLVEINLVWPILNLLPIWPLDGGQMAREVFVAAAPRNGNLITFAVSICVAGVLAIHCVMTANDHPFIPYLPKGGPYEALFFGYLCFKSFQGFQAENARRQRIRDEEFPWER